MKHTRIVVEFVVTALVWGFIAFAILPAHADEESVWLTTGEWSRHPDNTDCPYAGAPCRDRYRQNNTGVGIEYHYTEDTNIIFGWYNNSIHRESVYMGGTYTPYKVLGAKVGVMGAMATGYTEMFPAMPIAAFFASYEYESVGINFMWLPDVVAAVQLKVRIW